MSLEILGESFDLHGGGDDLVFPHHENERAQAEAAGHPFARHWVHSGMVEIGGEKMSKSLGNFTTLGRRARRARRPRVPHGGAAGPLPVAAPSSGRPSCGRGRGGRAARRAGPAGDGAGIDVGRAELDEATVTAFRTAMDNDFGTPAAMAAIFDAVKRANVAIDAGDTATAATLVATVRALVRRARPRGRRGDAGDDDAAEIDAMVAARVAARAARDFAEADRIRDELAARGITLEDTAGGTIWHR